MFYSKSELNKIGRERNLKARIRDNFPGQECPVGIALDIMLLDHMVGAGLIPGFRRPTVLSYKRKMQPKSNKKKPPE